MNKEYAPNNRTVRVSREEYNKFSAGLLLPADISGCGSISDAVICADTFEVLPAMPRGFAQLMIADPPYNLAKDYNGNRFSSMSDAEYTDYTARWLEQALPLLSTNATVYVCCDWRSSLVVGRVLSDYLKVRGRITWQREKGRGAAKNWKNCVEDIWFATVSDDYVFNLDSVKIRRRVVAPYTKDGAPKDWVKSDTGSYRDTCPSNFWDDITVPFWSMPENTEHPTQKPEKLLARLILASTNEGDTVLDPFLGSGSTAVTAKKLNRHYVGIEREEKYCVLAQKRLALAEDDKCIQGYENGIFYERNYKNS